MLDYLKEESNCTLTENGAKTLRTTGSDCVDLFATVGALRHEDESEIITRFMRAFTQDRDTAMRILFYARDIREGLGERRVFRVILRWLAVNEPESVRKNIRYIAEYGRFDDLTALFCTPAEKDAMKLIKEQLEKDISALENGDEVSLLAKWLPSVNTSNKNAVAMAKKIARYLGMNERTYRKTLVKLRAKIQIIENNLRELDYTFDYSKQPSKAMFKYRGAFTRNDGKRYFEFLENVNEGKSKLHTDTLAPYELVAPYLNYWGADNFMKAITPQEKNTLNTTWASLPDFSADKNVLPIIDTSGSMYCAINPMPAAVALSLGIYLAEHNSGHFRNHFIEFSAKPELIEIKGETFTDRLRYLCSFNQVANTDIEAVFDLILNAAVKNRVPQKELPEKLIIISDMEFDCCTENADMTNFDSAKAKFASLGYALPEIVFWNVASRNRHQPVKMNEQGVCLVSGCTPKIFSAIAGDELTELTPYNMMINILGSERYRKITA